MLKLPCRAAPIAQALAMLLVCAGSNPVQATLIVNSPRPITHRIEVQLIQASLTNGSHTATAFGDATVRASIEAGIDSIWAQAGIDIHFLPSITPYANDFAYQGLMLPTVERPINDLSQIGINAQAAGKSNSDSRVINMFFVNIAPGFKLLSESYVAAAAHIGGNGIAAFVGSNKLNTQNGHDAIAGVIAHEIGHNLGLWHVAKGIANLMSPQGTSDQMSQQQINDVFAFNPFFLQELPPMGDFTGDGMVNEADLAAWSGAYGINANGDGDGDGDSDGMDFLAWQRSIGVGAGLTETIYAVPEPATCGLLLVAVMGMLGRKRRV